MLVSFLFTWNSILRIRVPLYLFKKNCKELDTNNSEFHFKKIVHNSTFSNFEFHVEIFYLEKSHQRLPPWKNTHET